MSGFAVFVPDPPTAYPQPSSHFIAPAGPLPTNSWAENMIKGTVFHEGDPPGVFRPFPRRSRDTKPVPWFVSPYYGDEAVPGNPSIALGHATVGDITHSTQEGNNSLSISPRGFINELGLVTVGPTTLDLTSLDDGSAIFTFASGTTVITSRGSPFINIKTGVSAEAISLLFASSITLQGPTAILAEVRGTFRYIEIPFQRQQVTETATTNFSATGAHRFSIPIYSRYTSLPDTVSFDGLTFSGPDPVFGLVFHNTTLIGQFTGGVFSSTQGATYDAASHTITSGAIQIVLSPNVYRVLYTETVSGVIRFISNRIFTAHITGGTVILSVPIAAHMWIYTNDARTYWSDPALGYVTSMVASAPSAGGGYQLALTSGIGTALYFYTPLWWQSDYTIPGLNYLSDSVYDVTYRTCRLAVVDRAWPGSLSFSPLVPIPLPTLPSLPSELNLEAFRTRVTLDTQYYANLSLEAYKLETAYVFGQNIAKYGRILTFAQIAGVIEPTMYASFVSLLVSWLEGNNGQVPGSAPGSNALVHETKWGGIITLADYNVSLGIAGEGSFGNSFYNDHHFQYGYFFAGLYTLSVIGRSDLLTVYEPEIRQLLEDVVTAAGDLTSIATKTRHKDWYFGHSFATGLTDAVNIDQESVSEAINCYYQAWLLSGVMATLTSDARYQRMQAIAQAALYTEISTYRAFWTQNGADLETPSTTIVQAFSKTFAAFAPGQPSSYPSTSLYRYSIITLPFTDITPLFLDKAWVTRFSTRPEGWLRVDRDLIAGFCNYEKQIPNSWKYTPQPSPYDQNTDVAPPGITAWGFFGLQLLALGAAITEDEATRYYNKVEFKGMDLALPLDEDIIKRFDSFSNCFYVLYKQADYNKLPPTEGPTDNPIDTNTVMTAQRPKGVESRRQARMERMNKRCPKTGKRPCLCAPDEEKVKICPKTGKSPCACPDGKSRLCPKTGKRPCPCPPSDGDEELVEVPTIDILAEPTADGLDVEFVTFTVVDVIDWAQPRNRCKAFDQRIPTGLVPIEDTYITTITLTRPACNFNSVLNANGTSLLQKCRNLNAIAPYIIQYTYIRWVLSYLMWGGFKLKYLRRGQTERFFRDLTRSRFQLFYSEYFQSLSLLDYNGTLYDVTGYGNVPQNGKLYYIE